MLQIMGKSEVSFFCIFFMLRVFSETSCFNEFMCFPCVRLLCNEKEVHIPDRNYIHPHSRLLSFSADIECRSLIY